MCIYCVHSVLNFFQKAKDRDSGENQKIKFQVILVEFASTDPDDKPKPTDMIFYAETEQQDENGNYPGVIRSDHTLALSKVSENVQHVNAVTIKRLLRCKKN